VPQYGHRTRVIGAAAVQDPAVVVAAGDGQLLVVGVDALPERAGGAEVERRPGDRGGSAGKRPQFAVDRQVGGGDQGELMVEDGLGALAGQVEIGVVGQVDHGRGAGGGAVVDAQPPVREAVAHRGPQRPGEALVAVGADQGELDAAAAGYPDRLGRPQSGVESLVAAVQGVGARGVAERNLVGAAVQGEAAVGYPVAEAADGGPEEGGPFPDVALEFRVAQCDVHRSRRAPVRGGEVQGLQDGAVLQDAGGGSGAVGEGPPVDRGAVREGAEAFAYGSVGLG
jgi:hypothetical protein